MPDTDEGEKIWQKIKHQRVLMEKRKHLVMITLTRTIVQRIAPSRTQLDRKTENKLKYRKDMKIKLNKCKFALGMLLWFMIAIIVCVLIGAIYYFCDYKPSFTDAEQMSFWQFIIQPREHQAFFWGIFSSVLGVVFTFYSIRPIFSMSEVLARDNNGRLRFQITNKLWFADLSNVSIEMYYVRHEDKNNDERYIPIVLREDNVSIIRSRLDGQQACNYIGFTEAGFLLDSRYDVIRFRVIATHSVTGVVRVIEKEYTQKNIGRGVFRDGKFVAYESLYPTTSCKTWHDDIKKRCHTIWEVNENVLPILLSSKTLFPISPEAYNAAKQELEKLQNDPIKKAYFPCLVQNADTLASMLEKINELKALNITNLNPDNKKKRDDIVNKLNGYLVFLTQEMDEDVWNFYKNDNRG